MPALGTLLPFPLGGVGDPNRYARLLMQLLPPGRVWRLFEGLLVDLMAGIAQELARIEDRAADLLREAIPSTAVELLPEYEADFDLPSTGTEEERQARVVARKTARQRYRPADFRAALAPLLGQLEADVVVLERKHAMAAAMGDVREIFRFFIFRDPALPGTYYLDSAQAQVDRMSGSHTVGQVIESDSMLCDDPYSLCDRDLLGA